MESPADHHTLHIEKLMISYWEIFYENKEQNPRTDEIALLMLRILPSYWKRLKADLLTNEIC